jgi:hypothetical protein
MSVYLVERTVVGLEPIPAQWDSPPPGLWRWLGERWPRLRRWLPGWRLHVPIWIEAPCERGPVCKVTRIESWEAFRETFGEPRQ